MRDPTQRFADRVDDYVRYRPGYPPALAQTLRTQTAFPEGAAVADVGSGTGISSDLLLECGWTVYAVEPNEAMRREAERRLDRNANFHSIAGRAEATGLPDSSMYLAAAGQAFHWFDLSRSHEEFGRILRPGGLAALFWNARQTDTTPFLVAYEELLQTYGTDYTESRHRNVSREDIRRFLQTDYRHFAFPNEQCFDFEGLKGRLLSSSYTPGPEHPRHGAMLGALKEIFDTHQEHGHVRFLYTTELHLGGVGTFGA